MCSVASRLLRSVLKYPPVCEACTFQSTAAPSRLCFKFLFGSAEFNPHLQKMFIWISTFYPSLQKMSNSLMDLYAPEPRANPERQKPNALFTVIDHTKPREPLDSFERIFPNMHLPPQKPAIKHDQPSHAAGIPLVRTPIQNWNVSPQINRLSLPPSVHKQQFAYRPQIQWADIDILSTENLSFTSPSRKSRTLSEYTDEIDSVFNVTPPSTDDIAESQCADLFEGLEYTGGPPITENQRKANQEQDVVSEFDLQNDHTNELDDENVNDIGGDSIGVESPPMHLLVDLSTSPPYSPQMQAIPDSEQDIQMNIMNTRSQEAIYENEARQARITEQVFEMISSSFQPIFAGIEDRMLAFEGKIESLMKRTNVLQKGSRREKADLLEVRESLFESIGETRGELKHLQASIEKNRDGIASTVETLESNKLNDGTYFNSESIGIKSRTNKVQVKYRKRHFHSQYMRKREIKMALKVMEKELQKSVKRGKMEVQSINERFNRLEDANEPHQTGTKKINSTGADLKRIESALVSVETNMHKKADLSVLEELARHIATKQDIKQILRKSTIQRFITEKITNEVKTLLQSLDGTPGIDIFAGTEGEEGLAGLGRRLVGVYRDWNTEINVQIKHIKKNVHVLKLQQKNTNETNSNESIESRIKTWVVGYINDRDKGANESVKPKNIKAPTENGGRQVDLESLIFDKIVKELHQAGLGESNKKPELAPVETYLTSEVERRVVNDFDSKLYILSCEISALKVLHSAQTTQPFYRCAQWSWDSGVLKLGSAVPWTKETVNTGISL